jgi:hypothetical protein
MKLSEQVEKLEKENKALHKIAEAKVEPVHILPPGRLTCRVCGSDLHYTNGGYSHLIVDPCSVCKLIPPNRETGKTFRLLCEAFRKASEGKNVFYICPQLSIASAIISRAVRMLKESSIKFEVREPDKCIIIYGGGRIVFMSLLDSYFDQKIRGIKDKVFIRDHD